MKNPLISIVVPVYNAMNSIERCVTSILNQSYSHFELVLVNDGSKDQSLSICHAFQEKDLRIKVIDIPNGGVSNARNTGISHCKGEYLVFVDADDYIEEYYLEKMMNNYAQDALIMCSYFHETSTFIQPIVYGTKDKEICFVASFYDLYEEHLMPAIWNKLYDLETIKENAVSFRKNLSLGEDLLFNLDYIRAKNIKKLVVLNLPLYHYVQADEGSLSKSFSEKNIVALGIIYDEMINFMTSYVGESKQITFMKERFYYQVLYFLEMMYIKGQEVTNFAKKFIKKNDASSLEEILKQSKNIKLKVKLWVICYMDFKMFYRIFIRKKVI